MEKTIQMYNGKVFGVEVSKYGLENGYLDYLTLSKIIEDAILNNTIIEETPYEDWELACGFDDYDEIYQYYIISERGYQFLNDFTDEIVYYNSTLDLYLWHITHFGTAWDYVLTDIKLVPDKTMLERETVRKKLYEYYAIGRIDETELAEMLEELNKGE